MELPDLGKHCSEVTCKQLDYLPLRCDACEELFCKDHITYDHHKCSSAYKKDVQVPVCPLCDAPVPIKRGELTNIAVELHISRSCRSLSKQKIFTNRCCKAGCKKKELMRIECVHCQSNFCLSHRHPLDHDCKTKGPALSKAGYAALMRSLRSSEQNKAAIDAPTKRLPQTTDLPGRCSDQEEINLHGASVGVLPTGDLLKELSEDEALQRAVELSLLEAGMNTLLTLRNPNINTIKTTGP